TATTDTILCCYLNYLISTSYFLRVFFFFQAEDGIRDGHVTGVQTCALPISAGDARPPRAPLGCDQDEDRDAVRERPPARPPRVRLDAPQRRARVPLRLPRGHRGGAALAHVPGVREPDGLRRGGARLLGPARGAAGDRRRAALSRALLRLRARRRGSDRPRAADGAAECAADPSPPPAHHADPCDRGGAPPLLRAQ